MSTRVVIDALRERATKFGVDVAPVLKLIEVMGRDLENLEDDLSKRPSERVRGWIEEEIKEILEERPKHILAALEAVAGVEAKDAFADVLAFGIQVLWKVLL